jgi:hypothetical protein
MARKSYRQIKVDE